MFLGSGYFTSFLQRASTAESDPFSMDAPSRQKHALPTPDGMRHLVNLPSFLKEAAALLGSTADYLWLGLLIIMTDIKRKNVYIGFQVFF